jgi:dTDP-4-dehydrorhamnose 3,5-epimerase-like enzyme
MSARTKQSISAGPIIIAGDLFIDDRGELGFVNEFDMSSVKRFYTVGNHKRGFIRAWHAHKKEAKYVTVVGGAALIAAVEVDNWQKPSRELNVHRHVLSAVKPSVLYIPNGYANGFMTLQEDTKLIFFSTTTVAESYGDDYRFDARYWNPWNVIER